MGEEDELEEAEGWIEPEKPKSKKRSWKFYLWIIAAIVIAVELIVVLIIELTVYN